MSEEPKASILVVDDVEENRDILVRRLARQGYEVTAASGGEEALALAADGRFDLVLLDILMPGMPGLEVLGKLREMEAMKAVPVIMTTAVSDLETVKEAIALGAEDYVVKPIEMPILLAKVKRCLEAGEG